MIRKIMALLVLAAALLAGAAVPALASVHGQFAVVDNHGVLFTRQPLTVGQVVFSGGVAHEVVQVSGDEFRVIPALPASDAGKTVVFST